MIEKKKKKKKNVLSIRVMLKHAYFCALEHFTEANALQE
jgi:hypothetical protein